MKKIITLIITLSMILSCMIIPAYANDNITVELNGEEIYFDQPPIIQNGRTLVPMRAIFEAMGCDVVWHDNLKQIVVWKNDEMIMNLEIGRQTMSLFDLGKRELDVPPQIINGRTLVPLRAISESMGATVNWNDSTKTVNITYTTLDIMLTECEHTRTHTMCYIDLRKFEDIGDSTSHNVVDILDVICDNCGKTIESNKKIHMNVITLLKIAYVQHVDILKKRLPIIVI